MEFERPYFITPHAVRQFQSRISNVPAHKVMDIIMQALQEPKIIKEVHGVYFGSYQWKIFYIPVTVSNYPEKGSWPVVPTILGEDSTLHRKIMAVRRKRVEEARKRENQGDPEISRDDQ
ncbi:MAG: hypothetical protein WA125_17470 [Desulfosporosinus sp.]